MSFDERRQHPRVDESLSFQVAVDSQVIVAETKNISCGGALCYLSHPIPEMTKLAISFALPSANPHGSLKAIHCTGVIVRQQEVRNERNPDLTYLTAIYFSELKPDDKRRIAEFVLQSMLSHDRRRP